MKCLEPRTIRYEKMIMHVNCGKCEACLNRKRKDWEFRIMQEEKVSTSSYFVTLTYNDDNIPITDTGYTLSKSDCQSFFKKLRRIKAPKSKIKTKRAIPALSRKVVKRYIPKSNIRYFIAGEYGEKTKRPHYHAIIFNCNIDSIAYAWSTYSKRHKQHIEMGNVDIKPVNYPRIGYVTKYLINKNSDEYNGIEKPFQLASKGRGKTKGLGYGYIKKGSKFHAENMQTFVTIPGGKKLPLPKYYKDKMFNSQQKLEIYDAYLKEEYKKNKEKMEKIGVSEFFYLEQMRTITRVNRIRKSNKSSQLK